MASSMMQDRVQNTMPALTEVVSGDSLLVAGWCGIVCSHVKKFPGLNVSML